MILSYLYLCEDDDLSETIQNLQNNFETEDLNFVYLLSKSSILRLTLIVRGGIKVVYPTFSVRGGSDSNLQSTLREKIL